MRVEERLSLKKEAIERALDKILPVEDSLLSRAMRYAVFSGGKRFRPLLVLSSGECFQVAESYLLPFACAMELIHNYSLIHDDLPSMDNDSFRRGKPSCHMAFGEDVALLAGNGLLTLAFEIIGSAPFPPAFYPHKEKAVVLISQSAGRQGMIGGQFMDITFNPQEVSEKMFLELMLRKTAALIVASVKVGAILGEASETELLAMEDYGKNTGLAFQLRDDILDAVAGSGNASLSRPNYASFYGIQKAKEKLKDFVGGARSALQKAHLHSEELDYLASRLLVLEES